MYAADISSTSCKVGWTLTCAPAPLPPLMSGGGRSQKLPLFRPFWSTVSTLMNPSGHSPHEYVPSAFTHDGPDARASRSHAPLSVAHSSTSMHTTFPLFGCWPSGHSVQAMPNVEKSLPMQLTH